MNELKIPDVQALVRFGQLGVRLFAARLLSFIALVGFLSLAGYVAYSPSVTGAVVVGIALLAFVAALRAETPLKPPEGQA